MKNLQLITSVLFLTLFMASCTCSADKEEEKTKDKISAVKTETAPVVAPVFSIEGIADVKGEYRNEKTMESWTVYFSEGEQNFFAFYTKSMEGAIENEEHIIVDHIEKVSATRFKMHMVGIQGELVPTWEFRYNEEKKYYDLFTESYDAPTDTWFYSVFAGHNDNG